MNQTGSSRLTVEKVGKFIAGKISKSWDGDREEVLEILNLAQEVIYKSGLFPGATGVFTVKAFNKVIVTPPGYNILLGVNLNSKNVPLRDKAFIFHRNGPGSIDQCGWKYSNNVIDMGEYPTLCDFSGREKFQIAVKSTVCEPNFPKTVVSGTKPCGYTLYTYNKIEGDKECACICNKEDEETFEITDGAKYTIKNHYATFDNVFYSVITNISKDKTLGTVTYWKRYCDGNAELIATLGPTDTLSSYRRYQINEQCRLNPCDCQCPKVITVKCDCATNKKKRCHCNCDGTIEGLFKRSKPQEVIDPSQFFIINDLITILAFCKYVYFQFFKDSTEEAAPFFLQATALLQAESKVNESNTQNTLQFDSHESSLRPI